MSDLIQDIAYLIIGPREPVPPQCSFTLRSLQERRWKQSTGQERGEATTAARAIVAHLAPKKPWSAPVCEERTESLISFLARLAAMDGARNVTTTTVRPDEIPLPITGYTTIGRHEQRPAFNDTRWRDQRYSDRAMQDAEEIAGQLLGTR